MGNINDQRKPTEEQIYEIRAKIPSEYADFFVWGSSCDIIRFIILEWEKIREVNK